MADKVVRLEFESSVDRIVELNSSFDKGVLKTAYHGLNRNRSSISKESFEGSLHTIYNVPIVCNYIREEDDIGGHDMELVRKDGVTEIVNITQPVGVVPESALYWWETVEDETGPHEYLCVEVLLWKRQEAYQTIKDNGITAESMEITIKSGKMVRGVYEIYDFEFTAFCLLGNVEPCFESASLQVFSQGTFSEQYTNMMREFKECFANGYIPNNEKFKKGGEGILNEKTKLLAKYGMTAESLGIDVESISLGELEIQCAKAASPGSGKATGNEPVVEPVVPVDEPDASGNTPDGSEAGNDNEPQGEPDETGESSDNGGDAAGDAVAAEGDSGGTADPDDDGLCGDMFALTGQVVGAISTALSAVKVEKWGGVESRYWYYDSDFELSVVYCIDIMDWELYGFNYSIAGDVVSVDFTSKKHKKLAIVDFIDGDVVTSIEHIMETYANAKYSKTIAELQEFKANVEKNGRESAETELFAGFSDIEQDDAFISIKKDASKYTIEELEEKCFAIRGRAASSKFSVRKPKDEVVPKLPVVQYASARDENDEPYDGLFTKYRPAE